MPETETTTQEEAVSTNTQSDNLVSFLLDEKPAQQQQQTATTEIPKEEEKPVVTDEPYYKKYGWDSEETAAKEIAELKDYKEKVKPVEEWKAPNEESQKFYDYFKEGKLDEANEVYNRQKQVKKFIETEVNENTAADIVKFAMEAKYKDLTKEQIEYKFNKQFGIPKEPVQRLDELDEDFEARQNEWKEKVNEIKMDLAIEAKLAKPEIEKLKAELILPDIKKEQSAAPQLSQEDLKAMEAAQSSFLEDAQKVANDFTGFNVQVKDKDVDYNVGYTLSKEEKAILDQKVQAFTKDNFNANAIFAERWLDEKGEKINTEQVIKDLSLLYNAEKVHQKIAVDAANKRIEEYLKEKKNININETSVSGQFTPENKTEADKMREAILAI